MCQRVFFGGSSLMSYGYSSRYSSTLFRASQKEPVKTFDSKLLLKFLLTYPTLWKLTSPGCGLWSPGFSVLHATKKWSTVRKQTWFALPSSLQNEAKKKSVSNWRTQDSTGPLPRFVSLELSIAYNCVVRSSFCTYRPNEFSTVVYTWEQLKSLTSFTIIQQGSQTRSTCWIHDQQEKPQGH